ncbi:flagellar basal body-associated FliL family protein [uncultured Celeribacter sp.]|uniref:flagellar basal body-associated FliL family protein n=1 Tax=uncultured Celeribacter sp. TaxID=1303376 RepID=UPI002AA7CFE4|nr:flagellar basal body-associated FliL family protein [uncultured Celeribacter sp.]
MIKKLLPILLALIGLGAGVGGGLMLRPDPEIVQIAPCGDVDANDPNHHVAEAGKDHDEEAAEAESAYEYVKLNNQFVIPDLEGGRVVAMVVLSLSLEAKTGTREAIYAREPKLRDAFLQVLFDHANTGGFKGAFTDSSTMNALRHALLEVAQKTLGADIHDVLVIDIVRQDID